MILRIVKMTFKPESIGQFLEIFKTSSPSIRQFPGCRYVELVRDSNTPTIFFTISHWDSENDLDIYRNSELFSRTWNQTRKLFSDKAEAWSTQSVLKHID